MSEQGKQLIGLWSVSFAFFLGEQDIGPTANEL